MSDRTHQLGIRNLSSAAREGHDDVRARGSDILSAREFRRLGVDAVSPASPKADATT